MAKLTRHKMEQTRLATQRLLGDFYQERVSVHVRLIRNQMDAGGQSPELALEALLAGIGPEENILTVGLLISAAVEVGSVAKMLPFPRRGKITGVTAGQVRHLLTGRAEIVPIRGEVSHG